MLQTLRSGAAGWVAKVFLGLLVLSFAVWGIEDIFRIGRGGQNAAVIGDRKISVEEYRNAYTNELRRVGQQAGRIITPEQARMAGLGEKVLGDLVNEAAIDAKIANLKLSISDDEVVRAIQNDEMFKGPTGSFDRATFNEILRQNNLTEKRFLEMQRQFSARKQMTDALMKNIETPVAFRQAIHAFNSDSRSITFIALKPEDASAVPAPSEDALKAYYEANKASFAAPEYRKVAFISLDPKTAADWMEIPDADLRAYYDANKPQFSSTEKRSIEQIPFPSAELAKAAADDIKSGRKLFEQVWAELKMKPDDVYLGNLTKAEMLDPKIAEAAFALPLNQVSDPIQGSYATVLVRSTGVQKEEAKTFEAVRDDIKKVVAEERAKKDALTTHDKIDEARLGGATLDEIANQNKVEIREIEAVDETGKGPDGKPIADLPMQDKLLAASFRANVGEDPGTQSEGDAYLWLDVRGVTPPRPRGFDEVKAQVEDGWRAEEAGKRLDASAASAIAELKAGKTPEQVAAAHKSSVEQAETTRLGGAPNITPQQAKAIFQTPVDGFGQTPTDQAGGRLVYKVTADNDRPFDPSKPDNDEQLTKIAQGMGNDLMTSLVKQMRDQLGTKLDPAAIAQVTGAAVN